MGRIYFLMGKSASGKDTIYKKLSSDDSLPLRPYIGYTTRPIRSGEKDGTEYHFADIEDLRRYEREGRLIECRTYHTVYGDWYYFSVDTAETDPKKNDYLAIGTLESYLKMRQFYGKDYLVPIYLEVDDELRLRRAIEREMAQAKPGYEELCRRFLADSEDFCDEKLKEAGIEKRFDNTDLEKCLTEIHEYISADLNASKE